MADDQRRVRDQLVCDHKANINDKLNLFKSKKVILDLVPCNANWLVNSSDTRKVKVLSLPETIKEKLTFRAKALRRSTLKPLTE